MSELSQLFLTWIFSVKLHLKFVWVSFELLFFFFLSLLLCKKKPTYRPVPDNKNGQRGRMWQSVFYKIVIFCSTEDDAVKICQQYFGDIRISLEMTPREMGKKLLTIYKHHICQKMQKELEMSSAKLGFV